MRKKIVLSVRVDSETDKVLRALAAKEDRTVAATIRILIMEALKRRKLLKPKKR